MNKNDTLPGHDGEERCGNDPARDALAERVSRDSLADGGRGTTDPRVVGPFQHTRPPASGTACTELAYHWAVPGK